MAGPTTGLAVDRCGRLMECMNARYPMCFVDSNACGTCGFSAQKVRILSHSATRPAARSRGRSLIAEKSEKITTLSTLRQNRRVGDTYLGQTTDDLPKMDKRVE